MKFYDCVSKKKRDRYPHYVVSFKIKKRKVSIFKQEKQTIFLYWTWKRIVSKYNFKTWMCEFNILYDEKCLIWDTDKILMFEVLPKSRL